MTTPAYPTITEELLAELEQLAQEASEGPWVNDEPGQVSSADYLVDGVTMFDHIASSASGDSDPDDAAFIAAANPATILALLQHVRELKVDADRLNWLAENMRMEFGSGEIAQWSFDGLPHVVSDREGCLVDDLRKVIDSARSSATR